MDTTACKIIDKGLPGLQNVFGSHTLSKYSNVNTWEAQLAGLCSLHFWHTESSNQQWVRLHDTPMVHALSLRTVDVPWGKVPNEFFLQQMKIHNFGIPRVGTLWGEVIKKKP